MSGRRLVPTPGGPAVGGAADPRMTPPSPIDPRLIMNSTNASEMPPPVVPTAVEQDDFPPPGDEELGEPLTSEESVNFASLMTCGRRSKTLRILDHIVVIQTLCGSDDLRIGMYAKPYAGTAGEQRAYQIAVGAAAIRSINGQPIVPTLFENTDEDALFDQKIKKVEGMYPTVINAIYKGALAAEREFVELVDRLGKSFG
jgi:hypothetical protein